MLQAISTHPPRVPVSVPTATPAAGQSAVNTSGSEHPFFTACRNGQESDVAYLRAQLADNPGLAKGKYKSAKLGTDEEFDPLIPAAQKGNARVIELLCKHGADPNVPMPSTGTTPLQNAAVNGRLEAVKKLIEAGATMDVVDQKGHTALTLTFSYITRLLMSKTPEMQLHKELEARDRVIEQLLDWGADIRRGTPEGADHNTLQDLNKHKVLHLAAQMDWPGITAMLINLGAEVNHKDHNGNTALHCAASAGNTRTLHEIINNSASVPVDLEEQNSEGMTPLMEAACSGHTEAAELLLKKGANLHLTRAASIAVKQNKPEFLSPLITLRPEALESEDEYGNTPLMWALSQNRYQTTELLLEKGAEFPKNVPTTLKNVEEWDDYFSQHLTNGQTPLTRAAGMGVGKVVTMFLKRGADSAQQDGTGTTALHYAAYRGHCDVLTAITEHDSGGAFPNAAHVDAQDGNGLTALQLAAKQGKTEAAEILLAKGADSTEILHAAAKKGHEELLKTLTPLLASDQLDKPDREGNSPLALALSQGKLGAMEELLRAGASKELTNCPATDKNWKELINLPGIGKNKGSTMLNFAAGRGFHHTVALLLDYGADIDKSKCSNPLHLAAEHGHTEVINTLRNHPKFTNNVDSHKNPGAGLGSCLSGK